MSATQVASRGAEDVSVGLSAVLDAPRSTRIERAQFAAPAANQVRIRIEGCGLCSSNLPVWQGRPWFGYPLPAGAPGHEGWGIVDAIGGDVTGISLGDRVAALSYNAFAAYDLAESENVVLLPASLDGQPFPGEALGCAMNVFERCGVQPGQSVAVVGVGFLGGLLIRLAKDAGATVVGLSRRAASLRVAEQCGADATAHLQHDGAVDQACAWAADDGFDCVIEAAGYQQTLDLASQLVRTRGRLVVAGFHQDGPRTVDMQSWNWRGIDVINAHEREPRQYIQGIAQAAAAADAGRLPYLDLLTHRFHLHDLDKAFELATERPSGFVKAWIDCQ